MRGIHTTLFQQLLPFPGVARLARRCCSAGILQPLRRGGNTREDRVSYVVCSTCKLCLKRMLVGLRHKCSWKVGMCEVGNILQTGCGLMAQSRNVLIIGGEEMLCFIEGRRWRHFWDGLTLVSRKKERLSCMKRSNDRKRVGGAWLECSSVPRRQAEVRGLLHLGIHTQWGAAGKGESSQKWMCSLTGHSADHTQITQGVKVWGCFQLCQNND